MDQKPQTFLDKDGRQRNPVDPAAPDVQFNATTGKLYIVDSNPTRQGLSEMVRALMESQHGETDYTPTRREIESDWRGVEFIKPASAISTDGDGDPDNVNIEIPVPEPKT